MSIYEVIQSIAGLAIAGTFILQYRLNRMQAIQLRLSSMPIISVQYEEEKEAFFDPHIRDAGLLRIKAVRNVIYELWWECIDRKDLVFDTNGLSNMIEGDNYIKRFSHDKGGLSYFIIRASFKDIAGNEYIQDFKYWEGKFLPNAPKLKNNTKLD